MIKNDENLYGLLYLRVSSKRQEKEGAGLSSQEHRCAELCKRKNIPVENIFKDSFSGGGDFMNRPAMRELLKYIDNNPHKKYVVVFDDLKRFARDTAFHIKLRQEFNARQVTLKCLNFNFEDTPEGEFIETILAGQAQLERKQNQRQVIQKMKACLEGGYLAFGGKKIGYERIRDPLTKRRMHVPNTDADFIKEALEGFAYKRFLRRMDVARFLKDKNVFGNARPERYLKTVDNLLKDIFNAGFIEYKPWGVFKTKGIHEAIISLEVYDLNQRRLLGETKGQRIRQIPNPDFVLGGLVECEKCKYSMRYYWAKGRNQKYAYYECKMRNCSMSGKTIPRSLLEGDFNNLITGYRPKEGLVEVATEIFNDSWNDELKDVLADEQTIKTRKKELEAEFSLMATKHSRLDEGSVLEKQISNILEKKAEEIAQLNERIGEDIEYTIPCRTALDKVLGTLKKPLEMWFSADIFQKQKLFFFFFDTKLQYVAGEGYRTAQLSPVLRLFERFGNQNPVDVEMAGIEPASK